MSDTVPAQYFGNMLNQVLNLKLGFNTFLRDTVIMRKTTDRDQSWHGGNYMVPFEGGETSNYQSGGGLVKKAGMDRDSYVRGKIDGYKIIHGALQFTDRDLVQHGPTARIPQDTFLKLMVGQKLQKARNRFQFMFGTQMLNGGAFVKNTANVATYKTDDANGIITVDRPDRLTIGQRVIAHDTADADNSNDKAGFVKTIDMNSKKVKLVTTWNGTTAVNLSTVPQDIDTSVAGVGLYLPGDEQGGGFTTLADQILPATHGGATNLFGQTKTDYPYLQSIHTDGSAIATRKQFRDKLYDAFTDFIIYGQPSGKNQMGDKGNLSIRGRGPRMVDAFMSLRYFGVLQKLFQDTRGDYFKSMQGKNFGLFDIQTSYLTGPDGNMLRLIGAKGMRDDVVYIMGDNVTRFASLNFIRFFTSPDGNKWHTERIESGTNAGYNWICDYTIYGDLILKRPAGCGCITGLPDPTTLT